MFCVPTNYILRLVKFIYVTCIMCDFIQIKSGLSPLPLVF